MTVCHGSQGSSVKLNPEIKTGAHKARIFKSAFSGLRDEAQKREMLSLGRQCSLASRQQQRAKIFLWTTASEHHFFCKLKVVCPILRGQTVDSGQWNLFRLRCVQSTGA